MVWEGTSAHKADTLLTMPTGEERSERDEAKDFLREMLSGGPVASEQIKNEARRAGISDATLRRAKNDLGIKASHPSISSPWQWELPASCSPRSVSCSTPESGQLEQLSEQLTPTEEVQV